MTTTHRILCCFAALVVPLLCPGQTPLTDLHQITRDYIDNPVNADLLYQGKWMTFKATVGRIANAPYKDSAGQVYFDEDGHEWVCVFDRSRIQEIARLRRADAVVLKGLFAAPYHFLHCSVTPYVEPPVEETKSTPANGGTCKIVPPELLSKVEPEFPPGSTEKAPLL
jgi:hypothetical protein